MKRGNAIPLEHPPQPVQLGIAINEPGQAIHLLEDTWCLHLFLYRGTLDLDQKRHRIAPGRISLIPPGVHMRFAYHDSPSKHLYVLFRTGSNEGAPSLLPAWIDPGPAFEDFWGQLEYAVAQQAVHPARTVARLWDTLLRLTDFAEHDTGEANAHPAVLRVQDFIELNLGGDLTASRITRECAISQNHLNNLIRQASGVSLAHYIRNRRLQVAQRLMRETELPLKVIASQIGYPDLQHFNKLVRRECGYSPRDLRTRLKRLS